MENNINIAELLKDCPKGTKLYSPICGDCNFLKINPRGEILVYFNGRDDIPITFEADGVQFKGGECLLFPSKEIRDWSMFNVKYVKGSKGRGNQVKKLLNENGGWCDPMYFCEEDAIYYIDRLTKDVRISSKLGRGSEYYDFILSTGTELKLEEEPKFKVGDVVKIKINNTEELQYVVDEVSSEQEKNCKFACREEYLRTYLKNNQYCLATLSEIDQWNKETLEPNHLHYSTSKRKIIDWFLPKDDVLVRDNYDDYYGSREWRLSRFSHYSKVRIKENYCQPYCADSVYWNDCLPYNEKTAKLIGTTNDYKEE